MTVLTVTPNPALDITYSVDHLAPGETHRVSSVHVRPGGKGLNVARVLVTRGVRVAVTGLVGGADGGELRAGLAGSGLDDAMLTADDVRTRRTVTVVSRSDGTATLLNEPGPTLEPGHWAHLHEHVTRLVSAARVVTVSGSLPLGVSPDALTDLVTAIRHTGVPVIVDTSGLALNAVTLARPTVLKPNADELREATGIADPSQAATSLQSITGGSVVVSLGERGLLAVTPKGSWTARIPEPLSGNPTGAGDSVVAALALGLHQGWGWPETLREACALSAATVLAPVAGEYDAAAHDSIRPIVHVDEEPL